MSLLHTKAFTTMAFNRNNLSVKAVQPGWTQAMQSHGIVHHSPILFQWLAPERVGDPICSRQRPMSPVLLRVNGPLCK